MPLGSTHFGLRVLFITPEIHPLNKTGGLGDVSAALPAALRELNVDVRSTYPWLSSVLSGLKDKRKSRILLPSLRFRRRRCYRPVARASVPNSLFVIDCPRFIRRDGGPYADASGRNWPDNALRFGLLSKIGAILASDASPLAWRPGNCALQRLAKRAGAGISAFSFGRESSLPDDNTQPRFSGCFSPPIPYSIGPAVQSFDINGMEYYGGMSFLKAGLYYSDHICTVSPTYAREIQAAPLGFGMEGLLASRRTHISGIVNGIDTAEWNPASDRALVRNYTAASLSVKAANKMALQRRMGLALAPHIPLFGAVSRFTYQKGYDLLLQIATRLTDIPAQLIVLGSGDHALEQELGDMARRYPEAIAVRVGFDEKLAHLIEAGADSFLMPSRFEPCGLNQMYSQRYGTPPLVHATGGLLDTVVDCTPSTLADGSASGFLFADMTVNSFLDAILRVTAAYHNKPVWRSLMHNGMMKDFSWRASASGYRDVYRSLLA